MLSSRPGSLFGSKGRKELGAVWRLACQAQGSISYFRDGTGPGKDLSSFSYSSPAVKGNPLVLRLAFEAVSI